MATKFPNKADIKLFLILTLAEFLSRVGHMRTVVQLLPGFQIEWWVIRYF